MDRGEGRRSEEDWKVGIVGVEGREDRSVERWMLERRVEKNAKGDVQISTHACNGRSRRERSGVEQND